MPYDSPTLPRGLNELTIHASIHVIGEQALPNELFLTLRDSQGHQMNFAEVTPRGEAQFSNVVPDIYEIVARSPDKSYSIARISFEGQGITL